MQDNEPTLSSIDDYNTLNGAKKKVVLIVIVTGLLIGLFFFMAKHYYGNVDDSIPAQDAITKLLS